MAIAFERTEITPAMAAKWLAEANSHNRGTRPDRVEAYARDILAKTWLENGDALRFDENGVLLDGQHRLAAIVEADKAIPMFVVTGLPPEAQETMDSGIRRTLSDVLQLRGEIDVHTLAAVVRRALTYTHYSGDRMHGFTRRDTFTAAECLDFLNRHPELRSYTKHGKTIARSCFIPASAVGVAYWLFDRLDGPDTSEFMARLQSGANIDDTDPVYQLRSRAQQMHRGTARYPTYHYLALTIKAWNAYRLGQTVTALSFRSGGAAPEPFPEPK
ncbi:hypothetical protein ACWD2L_00325 [Streptomyces sp. NPDC002754]